MYVEYGNSFNIYGSLTIIVIFMMWLYICIYIMFMGAYINKYMIVWAEEWGVHQSEDSCEKNKVVKHVVPGETMV